MKYLFSSVIFSILFICSCDKDSHSKSADPEKPQESSKIYLLGDTLNYEDYVKVWSDDFDQSSMVNLADWSYEKAYVRNKENQYYTVGRKENCRIEEGVLVIEGRKEEIPYEGEALYTSASIITAKKHSWMYGRFEIRAKVPSGKGTWPAFWMKGENQISGVPWPKCGEIDIMEYAGKNPNIMIHNAIYNGANDKAVNIAKQYDFGKSLANDYHIYSLEWDKNQLVFAIDNVVTHTVSLKKLPLGHPFNQKFTILLNLALGSNTQSTLGGPLDDAILPVKYFVDYVHVYQKKKL